MNPDRHSPSLPEDSSVNVSFILDIFFRVIYLKGRTSEKDWMVCCPMVSNAMADQTKGRSLDPIQVSHLDDRPNYVAILRRFSGSSAGAGTQTSTWLIHSLAFIVRLKCQRKVTPPPSFHLPTHMHSLMNGQRTLDVIQTWSITMNWS